MAESGWKSDRHKIHDEQLVKEGAKSDR